MLNGGEKMQVFLIADLPQTLPCCASCAISQLTRVDCIGYYAHKTYI